ncbi:hypothetical protein ABK040_010912 [Willaertia magna]
MSSFDDMRKLEVQMTVRNQITKQIIESTKKCFDFCIPNAISEKNLSLDEKTCINNCVSNYLDSAFILRAIPLILVSLTAVLLIFCVVLSLLTGPEDVSDHLPTLSETGIYPPTKYLFTFSLMIPSISIIIGSFLYFFTIRDRLITLEHQRHSLTFFNGCCRMHWLNITTCIFALIAGVFLLLLGIIPLQSGEVYSKDVATNSSSMMLATTISNNNQQQVNNLLNLLINNSKYQKGTLEYSFNLMSKSLPLLLSSFNGQPRNLLNSNESKVEAVTIIHLVCNLIFSISIITHMILATILAIAIDRKTTPNRRYLHPWVIVKICSVVLVLFMWPICPFILGIITVSSCTTESIYALTCSITQIIRLVIAAILQYGFVFSILVFMTSYMYELSDAYLNITNDTGFNFTDIGTLSLEQEFESDEGIELSERSHDGQNRHL